MAQYSVNGSNLAGMNGTVQFHKLPDECPICHRGTNPRIVGSVVIGDFNTQSAKIQIVFQCTWNNCSRAFFGHYAHKNGDEGGGYYLETVFPKTPQPAVLPESVGELSASFVKIYNQSLSAEAFGLDEVAGIGLRKALEFLIKDFLIHEYPNEADTIKGKLLGKCIDDHVTDSNIKATAKRAAWLGNDETHYVRKWEDKDIKDLKVLIRLTINWIDSVLLTQKYANEMNT